MSGLKKENIIDTKNCWFHSKRFLQLVNIATLLHFGTYLSVKELTWEMMIAYFSILVFCNSTVCFFLKRAFFYPSHIEYYYPFRYWNKKRYEVHWNEIIFFSFRGGFKESRFQLKSNLMKLRFGCTKSESEQLILKLKEELQLKRVDDYSWKKTLINKLVKNERR
jgi:hypothetical protein